MSIEINKQDIYEIFDKFNGKLKTLMTFMSF